MRTLAIAWLVLLGGAFVFAAATDPHRKGAIGMVIIGGLTVASAVELWEPGL